MSCHEDYLKAILTRNFSKTFGFSPNILARDSKMPNMTMSVAPENNTHPNVLAGDKMPIMTIHTPMFWLETR